MKKILIPLLGFLLLVGAGCIVKSKPSDSHTTTPEPVICTQDAKQCPDGSYVGRTGPNCEFAPCPETKPPTNPTNTQTYKNWKTIIVGGVVSFQIPPQCNTDAGAGSMYVNCPTNNNETPSPEFVFSSDGIQVNIKRWEGLSSPYWNDVLASMKVIQPLTHNIQINIDK
jgi:hypothetical protein